MRVRIMVTKKTTKSQSKKTSKQSKAKKAKIIYKEPKQKKDYFFPIILIITAVIIIGFVSNGTFFLGGEDIEQTIQGDTTVLVEVNGDPIYQGELDEYWNRLPPQLKLQISREQLLDEFIQERLLLQEAEKKRIEVSSDEVNEYITAQLSASGITLDQFEMLLEQQGTTLERMREIYVRQLKLAKLFEERSDEDLVSSQEEVEAYYEENKENFYLEEQVTLRHLLIPINEQVDEETAQERVNDLEAQLDEANNENFCELVSEFSADPGSVNNCGEYTFSRGMMVSEFEEAGFSMEIGERRTIQTTFGYHIMLKDANIAAGYYELSDSIGEETVEEIIQRVLAETKAREIYEEYIQELQNNAEIIYPQGENSIEEENTIEAEVEVN
jgi:parvulin-like peptidyl-prolyl isomerase